MEEGYIEKSLDKDNNHEIRTNEKMRSETNKANNTEQNEKDEGQTIEEKKNKEKSR